MAGVLVRVRVRVRVSVVLLILPEGRATSLLGHLHEKINTKYIMNKQKQS